MDSKTPFSVPMSSNRYHIIDLPRVETKLRHCRMARHDPFSKSFGEVLDRVLRVQRPECGRDLQRTRTYLINCMTFGAVRGDECQPPLRTRLQGMSLDDE